MTEEKKRYPKGTTWQDEYSFREVDCVYVQNKYWEFAGRFSPMNFIGKSLKKLPRIEFSNE